MELFKMAPRMRGLYIAGIIGGGIALPAAVKAVCWAVLKIAGWL